MMTNQVEKTSGKSGSGGTVRGMEPLYIRIEMLKCGVTGGTIARSLGLTSGAVNSTVSGRIKARWIREAIAAAIKKPYLEVWGEE
jgi:hypothetical protein